MAALKDGAGLCYIHSPATMAARSAARSRGGSANRRPEPSPAASPSEGAPPFELAIERRADIPQSLLRVAMAVAAGRLDTRRARVLVESLRGAEQAFAAIGEDGPVLPAGTREATADEVDFMAEHGRPPPGVEPYPRPFLVLDGPIWKPPAADAGE